MMTRLVTALVLSAGLISTTAAAESRLDGIWARGDGNAKVRLEPCGQDVCAVNTWIKPGTPSEKAGDKLVMSVKPEGNGTFEGTAFDPQRNLNYNIRVSVNGKQMVTKGCVLAGIICKDVSWTRID
jgi:uncharacterized protein (DUF2147 family)